MKTTIRTEQEKQRFIEHLNGIEVKCAYRAEFSRIQRKRSLSQNNLMWLYLTIGEQDTGNERNDLYSYFLTRFPITKDIEILDEIQSVQITSSQFNTSQMTQFIENIRRVFAEMGIPTPEPNSDKCMEIYYHYRDKGLL